MNDIVIIENKIYEIRGQKVMLDFDLAEMYEVTTGNFNKAIKRNIERFPARFLFRSMGEQVLTHVDEGIHNINTDFNSTGTFQNSR